MSKKNIITSHLKLFVGLLFVVFYVVEVRAKINHLDFDRNTVSNVIIKSSSSVTTGTSTSSTSIIYGGMAGSDSSCDKSTNTVCNSCSSVIAPCNQKRIYPTLDLIIYFQTDKSTVITENSRILIRDDDSSLSLDSTSTQFAINTTLFAKISWSRLCEFIGATSTCATDLTSAKTLNIGIDGDGDGKLDDYAPFQVHVTGTNLTSNASFTNHSNCATGEASLDSEGFCYFKLYEGDKKAYVTDTLLSETYNVAPNGTTYQYVRFYYNESNSDQCSADQFVNVTPESNYFDLTTTNSNNTYYLKENYLSGLTNYVGYYFRMANVDSANNVFYFTKDADLTCEDHFIVPQEVTGLLDGQSCFIATAAFGSPMTNELNILRAFRDKFLLTNLVGTEFVKWYYSWSPKAANYITQSEFLRSLVRGLLWPFITLAQWSLNFNFNILFLFLSGIISVFIFITLKKSVSRFISNFNPRTISAYNSNSNLSLKKSSKINLNMLIGLISKLWINNLFSRWKLFILIFGLIFIVFQTQAEETYTETLIRKKNDNSFEGVEDDGSYIYTESDEDYEKDVGEVVEVEPNPENYKNGLLKTTNDGSYLYKVEIAEHHNSFSLRMGKLSPPKITIETPEGATQSSLTFDDMYGENSLNAVLIDYSWEKAKWGVWSFSVGTGMAQTSAQGRFKKNPEVESMEKYIFYIIPNHISFAYRFQYSHRPWMVPYITAGLAPFILMEKRDDGGKQTTISAQAVTGAGGLKINLGAFDSESAFVMDAEYGIANIWLDVEARLIQGLQKNRDVSSNMINAGVGFDF